LCHRCHGCQVSRCHKCRVSRVSGVTGFTGVTDVTGITGVRCQGGEVSQVSQVSGVTGVTGVTGVRCHGFHGCHRCHGCQVSRVSRVSQVSRVSGVTVVSCHGCWVSRVSQVSWVSRVSQVLGVTGVTGVRCHGCHRCQGVTGVRCHGCHRCHGVTGVTGVTGVRCHGCQVSSVLCSPTLVSPAVIMEERLSPAPHTPVTAGAWRAGDIATQQPLPLGQEVKGGSGASSPTSPRRTHGVRSPRRVTSPQDRSPQRTGHPSVLIEHGDVSVRSWVTGGDRGDTLSPALTDGVHGGGLCVSHSSQRWTRDTQWPPLGFHLEIVTAVTPGL
jgi:hypothetical protein